MEDRILIQFVHFFLLDERCSQSTIGQYIRHGHEDGGHGDEAELIRIDQTSQDDRNDKGDDLDGALLEQLPEDPRNGLVFQIMAIFRHGKSHH